MRSRRHREDLDLDLAPPAELVAMREALVVPPSPELRAQHLAATAGASRRRVTAVPAGRLATRFASRSAKAVAAVVAGLAITSGLAGAQLLPQPAQRLLSNVSERFAPSSDSPDSPPATAVDVPETESSTRTGPDRTVDDEHEPGGGTTSTSAPAIAADLTPSTTERLPVSTTTIPGPSGPGSPTDPTDPATTTTTTVDPSTTTTTTPPTTTTTEPTTTTTTGAP